MPENYLEFCFKIPHAHLEVISDQLFEIGALGIEELEAQEAELAYVKVYFPSNIEGLEKSIALLGQDLSLQSKESKPVLNWQENWKEHFKPLSIGNKILVRPPWEPAQQDKVEVVINPGLGFGTGYHESTRLALEILEEIAQTSNLGKVMDIGAGSGILTIAALKMGATSADCCELEAEALAEIPQNLEHSGLATEIAKCLLGGPEGFHDPCETVIANITGDVLLELASEFERLTKGKLLLSGIVDEYVEPLKIRMSSQFELIAHRQLPPWNALAFKKKS